MYLRSEGVPLPCSLGNQLWILHVTSLAPTNAVLAAAVDTEPDAPPSVSVPSPKKQGVGKWSGGGARDDLHRRGEAAAGPSPTRVDAAEHALWPHTVVCIHA